MRKKSKKKIAKVKKPKVPRTRNHGRWTESTFWSFIRSSLRQKSRWWIPILEAKKRVKRAYNGPNKRQKFEYKCASCGNFFADKNCQVDHIIPAGTLKCATDLPLFVENLFIEIEGLQVLCTQCHDKKTKKDNEKRTKT
jgi:5-methylcytosine-specific restriction endonuclease McrA